MFCSGGQLYHIFSLGRRRKSAKKSEENAGEGGEVGTKVWSKLYTADYCIVSSQRMHMTTMEELERLMMWEL